MSHCPWKHPCKLNDKINKGRLLQDSNEQTQNVISRDLSAEAD